MQCGNSYKWSLFHFQCLKLHKLQLEDCGDPNLKFVIVICTFVTADAVFEVIAALKNPF